MTDKPKLDGATPANVAALFILGRLISEISGAATDTNVQAEWIAKLYRDVIADIGALDIPGQPDAVSAFKEATKSSAQFAFQRLSFPKND